LGGLGDPQVNTGAHRADDAMTGQAGSTVLDYPARAATIVPGSVTTIMMRPASSDHWRCSRHPDYAQCGVCLLGLCALGGRAHAVGGCVKEGLHGTSPELGRRPGLRHDRTCGSARRR
jgi:hypothetical protein